MVTHSSTSRPVQCLCMAERTGCPVFTDLWSYVLIYSRVWYTNCVLVHCLSNFSDMDIKESGLKTSHGPTDFVVSGKNFSSLVNPDLSTCYQI